MLVLRCTTNAFKKLDCKPQSVEVAPTGANLGEWYVRTVDYLDDGDWVLACMHTESLFIIMVPSPLGMDGDDFVRAFRTHLLDRLLGLETPPKIAGKILAAYGESAALVKNTDRKVAGYMNAALSDLGYLLDIPKLNLISNNQINFAHVEHLLNDTPRNCSKQNTIWPLIDFWQYLTRQWPELPPRTIFPIRPILQFQPSENENILRKHLPPHLASKFLASLKNKDMLYTADELRTLASISESDRDFASFLPEFAAEMHRIASFRLERLLDGKHA